MRDIGWVPPPQHHQDSTEQQHPSHYTKPQREKRKEGSSLQQFVPFDYNSAQQQPTNPGNTQEHPVFAVPQLCSRESFFLRSSSLLQSIWPTSSTRQAKWQQL